MLRDLDDRDDMPLPERGREMKIYKTGLSEWIHGEKWPGINDYHIWLGPCPDCGSRTFDYGGGWRCIKSGCTRGTSNLAPSVGAEPTWWKTGINVIKDGDAWMAHYDDFINLQESPCSFGDSPQEAVDNLIEIKPNPQATKE